MFRAQIKEEIKKILEEVFPAQGEPALNWSVERSENPAHGDYSSNVALVLSKKEGKSPKEVAEKIKKNLEATRLPAGQGIEKLEFLEKVEIAGPGFLNFFIAHKALIENLSSKNFLAPSRNKSELNSATARPHLKFLSESFSNEPKKINIEFVSANPTGPLTMANGRGGFYGDALANILKAMGNKVTREYYINDAGNQINLLGERILAVDGKIPEREEFYKGAYIKTLKGKTAKQAIAVLLKEIKNSLKKAGIIFDNWYSEEKNLHKKNALKTILEFLNKKKAIHEKDGALWLGDNVVIKSSKEPTYFLADLAYHYDKFLKRKFDIAIDVWGADHHGYIERLKKGVEALGIDQARLQIIIMQLVRLISGGKEVKMSKRAGEFITLDDLLKDIGIDAARWFFLERSPNTHMDFDLDLAKERSKKNPVYYVQYAHARACSILKKSKSEKFGTSDVQILSAIEELNLIKKILQLPEIIEDIAVDYQVHRLTRYAYELAQSFTNFYEKHLVIDPKNNELTQARLELVKTTQNVLKQTLELMGISAPDRM